METPKKDQMKMHENAAMEWEKISANFVTDNQGDFFVTCLVEFANELIWAWCWAWCSLFCNIIGYSFNIFNI